MGREASEGLIETPTSLEMCRRPFSADPLRVTAR